VARTGAIVGSIVSWFALFFVLPAAIGARGRRIGWKEDRSGWWNRLGLISVGAGSAGLLWCMLAHYRPGQMVEVSLTPEFLIGEGPYNLSRNPMYVCEQAIWMGWASYFGSPSLIASGVALGGAMRYAVSREEKTLRAQFGSSWEDYASRVRRWL
jgi:protein-S-isoprenylcysteine O-methyltransferase Ste14